MIVSACVSSHTNPDAIKVVFSNRKSPSDTIKCYHMLHSRQPSSCSLSLWVKAHLRFLILLILSVLSLLNSVLLSVLMNVVCFFFSYLFHYICHDRIIYLCITDDVSIYLAVFVCAFLGVKVPVKSAGFLINVFFIIGARKKGQFVFLLSHDLNLVSLLVC